LSIAIFNPRWRISQQRPIQAAVLDGLRDVVGGDIFGALQVGYGAGDFENRDQFSGLRRKRFQAVQNIPGSEISFHPTFREEVDRFPKGKIQYFRFEFNF
jgi:hypothetical protein